MTMAMTMIVEHKITQNFLDDIDQLIVDGITFTSSPLSQTSLSSLSGIRGQPKIG